MLHWSTNLLLLGSFAADTGGWPQPLHVATAVSEEAGLDPSISQKTNTGVQTFVNQSRSYALLSDEQARRRLGSSTAQLVEQCGSDHRCWQQARQRLGVDLLLHLAVSSNQRGEHATLHLYTDEGKSVTEPHTLPRGGGAPLELLEELLLAPGTVNIALENGSTHLQINGEARLLSPNRTVQVSSVPPGNHKLIVEGLGLPQRLEVVRVLPGQTIEIPLNSYPTTGNEGHYRWWGAWASGALLLGGGIAILSGSGRDGIGWR